MGEDMTLDASLTSLKHEQVYMVIAFFLEAIVYGIYFVLFIGAVHIMSKDRSRDNVTSRVFFFSMIFMFILTTVFTGINAYRFTRAYAQNDGTSMPVLYFWNFDAWDNFSYVVVVIILVLYADALVIYRCFVIWGGNYYVIAFPTLLLLLSIGINGVTMSSFIHPASMNPKTLHAFFTMIYPVNLAQNCLTTGLIAYKIWRQHRNSQKAGLVNSSGLNLITVVRIMIESASIFTFQQLVLLILHLLNHRAQVILHATMVPSIGIVFVLIAIRTNIAKADVPHWPERSSMMIPSYLRMDTPTTNRPPSSVGALTTVMTDPGSDLSRTISQLSRTTDFDEKLSTITLQDDPAKIV
ncbi:hypothetical protein FA15DRAFT_710057 [Coprinopsis marcescibilis]|uniref:Uncharacterized protein n=1 Tax=Coprinopsis marcescibilis TaxID=230819 RepID=A0A5C3KE52_COPMA|nr:hypothetical protein FA15DRAFT_710057 [Coprinopsis marcescibilis]